MSEEKMPQWLGPFKLSVKIVSAIIERNTDMFDKMDPYCIMDFTRGGGKFKKSFRTQTHFGGHKEPIWNYEFVYYFGGEPTGTNDDKVKFSLFEEDLASSDIVGESDEVLLTSLLNGN